MAGQFLPAVDARSVAPRRPAPERAPAAAPPRALEPPPPPVPAPLCDFQHETDARKWMNCWYTLASPPDCYACTGNNSWPGDPEWTGECIAGLATGS